ncbi:hypothetical protein VYU27_006288 [Nannochloropsis oceanica]
MATRTASPSPAAAAAKAYTASRSNNTTAPPRAVLANPALLALPRHIPPAGQVGLGHKGVPINQLPEEAWGHVPLCRTRGQVCVAGLKRKLAEGGPKLWQEEEARKSNVGVIRPSHDAWGIGKIVFVYCDDFLRRCFEMPWMHDPEWRALLLPIFDALGVPPHKIVRCLLASMPPGIAIPPHHDTGYWVHYTHRIHLPVITDPAHIAFRVGPSDAHLQRFDLAEGHLIELNNQAKHSVDNCWGQHRVHLIMDYIEGNSVSIERTLLSPGTKINQTRRSIDLESERGIRRKGEQRSTAGTAAGANGNAVEPSINMLIEMPTWEQLQESLSASANATSKIVFLVLIGVAATAHGVFNDQGVSDLGRLVYHVTLPALLFVNIISEVTLARLLVLWKLPAMALLHVSSGYLLAKCLTSFFRIRGIGNKAVTLSLMFGNVGSLAIAVVDTLCADEPLASEVGPTCALRGVEYISFYLITQTILMFTWAEEIVKDGTGDEDEDEDDDEDEDEEELLHSFKEEDEEDLIRGTFAGGEGDAGEVESPTYATPVTIPGAASPPPIAADGQVQHQQRIGLLSSSRRRNGGGGSFVRFHTSDSDADDSRHGRIAPSSDGGGGTPRLRRLHSQSQILDEEDINSILSRYAVESRPRLDAEVSGGHGLGGLVGLAGSLSSTHLPSFSTSPALFRRRGSRTDMMQQQQQQQQQQEEEGQQEKDRLLGRQRRRSGSMGRPGATTYQTTGISNSNSKSIRSSGDISNALLIGTSGGSVPPSIITTPTTNGSLSTPSAPPPPPPPPPPSPPPPPPPSGIPISTLTHSVPPLFSPSATLGLGGTSPPPPTNTSYLASFKNGALVVLSRMVANPSIRAALLAFFLGLIPPIKALFVSSADRPNPPLGAFLGAMQILGQAQVPCSMLMLSGSGTIRYLNDKAAQNNVETSFAFSPKVIFCIILGRVLLFPLVGLFWWWAGYGLGLFVGTPVLSLVVLLDAAVPTAQNVVMLILVHGKAEHGHALAYVILWQYALCIPMLILNVTLYLAIIRTVYPL